MARYDTTLDQINAELDKAVEKRPEPAQPEAVSRALLPPLTVELPKPEGKAAETRFDLVVNNAPANQVFLAVVSGTPYSMLVHPGVREPISLNLKDVTVFDALDAIRELYGYEYKVDGTRIFIQSLTLQTRVFQVNYLEGKRKGSSDIRVTSSGAITTGAGGVAVTPIVTTTGAGGGGVGVESSKITTTSTTDFWEELTKALTAIIGKAEGRHVVVSPQSGVVVVRAMPAELRNVAAYLKAAQVSVERQVILEAKILEVQLNDGFQSGINWAAFRNTNNSRGSVGQLTPGTTLSTTGTLTGGTTATPTGGLSAGTLGNVTIAGTPIISAPGTDISSAAGAAGALFGLAFQTSNFAALISFLETQGNVHVLSSPRIATLNNQKAVLKVGQDELFVTNVSTTTTTGTATTTTPTVTLQSFFSGIALDVTPRIDEDNNIILHIHPSVSDVRQVQRNITLGGTLGSISIPVPRSAIQETDSVIRARDGQIVAIGGLITQSQTTDRSQIPGLGDLPVAGNLFRENNKVSQKRELVILLKPTVIHNDTEWQEDILQARERVQSLRRDSSSSKTDDSAGK
ncbi:MAG TPA: pilus (MSHA type) biogenesis protein MshL [Burkholderiales bacterium]|nr:pilus (MSHA type) biogenesis protein MshL [Burkholderiales bacterium]